MFLNDIADSLPCDSKIGGCAIKALLYADNIVILAESPVELQTIINALHKYCLLWGLLVNTEKSKVKFKVYSARTNGRFNNFYRRNFEMQNWA